MGKESPAKEIKEQSKNRKKELSETLQNNPVSNKFAVDEYKVGLATII